MRAAVPLTVLALGVWLVADPRGLADAASLGGDRAWQAAGDVVAQAAALLRER